MMHDLTLDHLVAYLEKNGWELQPTDPTIADNDQLWRKGSTQVIVPYGDDETPESLNTKMRTAVTILAWEGNFPDYQDFAADHLINLLKNG